MWIKRYILPITLTLMVVSSIVVSRYFYYRIDWDSNPEMARAISTIVYDKINAGRSISFNFPAIARRYENDDSESLYLSLYVKRELEDIKSERVKRILELCHPISKKACSLDLPLLGKGEEVYVKIGDDDIYVDGIKNSDIKQMLSSFDAQYARNW